MKTVFEVIICVIVGTIGYVLWTLLGFVTVMVAALASLIGSFSSLITFLIFVIASTYLAVTKSNK